MPKDPLDLITLSQVYSTFAHASHLLNRESEQSLERSEGNRGNGMFQLDHLTAVAC